MIALLLKFLEYVATVLAVGEFLRTAAENEVYTACRIIADKLLLLVAVDVMAAEVARSGVPQTACHSHASILAQLLSHVYERSQRLALRVDAHGMIDGLNACGKRSAARTGVGHQLFYSPSLRQARSLSVLQP